MSGRQPTNSALLRWTALAAPLAAGTLNSLARWAHMRAFAAQAKLLNLPPAETTSEIAVGGLVCLAPWLVIAAVQAATIRKDSVLMDFCRLIALPVALLSMSISWSDLDMWWPMAAGPHGEPLPLGDFDSYLDGLWSVPLCLVSLTLFSLHRWLSRL